MQRAQRLQTAHGFVAAYRGKRIVLGYARWFGVDRTCAILELRLLGVPVPAYEDEAAANAIACAQTRRRAREAKHGDVATTLDSDRLVTEFPEGGDDGVPDELPQWLEVEDENPF